MIRVPIEQGPSHIPAEEENADKIVAIHEVSRRFAEAEGPRLAVEIPSRARHYIRFECWGKGERFAWTQPFFLE